MGRISIVAFSLLLAMVTVSQALAPQKINYQGLLLDNFGDPVADGSYLMVLTIYDDAIAGAPVWTETQNVNTIAGVFAVLLGSVNPLEDSVFNGTTRYLGITVGADPELIPRTALVTVPYSFRTGTIDGARGGVLSGAIEFDDRSPAFDPPYIYLLSEGVDTLQAKKLLSHSTAENQGLFFYYPTTRSFGFGITPGLSALFIDPITGDGQVGINTQNPQSALDVAGTLRAEGVELGVNPFRSGFQSTIGGGGLNTVSANWATTAGGQFNVAGGEYSTVSGGQTDSAAGRFATAPGGHLNSAAGDYSFAAGRRAKALNDGVFVWSDATDADFASTGNNQFLIQAAGGVGIGTNAPSEALHVAGNICYTGSIAACSDLRYKMDITPLASSLTKVTQLRGVTYRWNQDKYPDRNFDDKTHVGFVAQEVEQLFPQLVTTDRNGYKSVDYGRLTPVLLEAIKEQQKQIDELKNVVNKLLFVPLVK